MQTTHKIIEVTKVTSLGATCVSAASIVTFLKKSRIILTILSGDGSSSVGMAVQTNLRNL